MSRFDEEEPYSDLHGECAAEIDRLQARVAHLEQLVTDAVYTLSTARFWDGQKWSYHSLHPIKYTQMRDRLAVEADAIYAARETK